MTYYLRLATYALCLLPLTLLAQRQPDKIYMPSIHAVKLYKQGNQESVAMIKLNSGDQLELHFDDLGDDIKNYYYTYQLCNADWQPADLSSFDYLKGYQQQHLNQYRVASIALTHYIHYQTLLPDKNCMPTRSGNYLLKVFLDGDTSQLAFTKRLYVVDSRAGVIGSIQQPFDNQLTQTHQKLQFSVDITQLNASNPSQQIKVAAVQNYKWDDAIVDMQPSFIRGNLLEYNGEQDFLFEAGKEYRWVDLRSFRFESERIDRINKNVQPNIVFVKPDGNLNKQRYLLYQDNNGWMDIATTESVNTWWQTDYANVIFTYWPDGGQPLAGKNLYLVGEMTQNRFDEDSRMVFNPSKGVYQKALLLKQGYYGYSYATKDVNKPDMHASPAATEGNYWEAENDYMILVYYRSYSGRHDELVGMVKLNSITNRAGAGF
ncbi:DUF5103 domain-containing protein [Parasediminibacterium sp. JCM 36343]|uniref:type IX secretion system plug protein n=1 Tax=Parasediminibacterium sp. JCM 36343 TaxID=3374279 RepID=UPI0039798D0B